MQFTLRLLSLAVAASLALSTVYAQSASARRLPDRYGSNPPHVGDAVANAPVFALDGKAGTLAAFWRDRPTVLITASITCGPSCGITPDLKPLQQAFGDRVNIVILYVKESHPDGQVSPYYPSRPAKPAKAEGGYKQPSSLAERLHLAREFKATFKPAATIVVDDMDNAAWQAVGQGPNLGLLIGTDGILVFKQGWFSIADMLPAVEAHLANRP